MAIYMMINDGNGKKRVKKIFGTARILYAVAGIAVIAVSIVSYSSITAKIKKSTEDALTAYGAEKATLQAAATTQAVTNEPLIQKPTEKSGENAEAVFENNAETVAAPVKEQTDAPVAEPQFDARSCVLPLSASVSKDYSLGIPVFSQTMGDWRTHNGVDFAGYEGDEVPSISDCIVTSVYQDDLWGGVVETECCGIKIKYCGLSFNEQVKVGDELSAGDTVGTLSKIPIEQKDGFHIHVEMRKDGEICDPLEILGLAENDID